MTSALSDRIKELEAALADAQERAEKAEARAERLERSREFFIKSTREQEVRATAAEAENARLREAGEEFCDAVENDVAHGVDVHDDTCGVCRSRAAFRKVLDPPTPPGEGISDE